MSAAASTDTKMNGGPRGGTKRQRDESPPAYETTVKQLVTRSIQRRFPKAQTTWKTETRHGHATFSCASATSWSLVAAEELLVELTRYGVPVNSIFWQLHVQPPAICIDVVISPSALLDVETVLSERRLLQATSIKQTSLQSLIKMKESLLSVSSEIPKDDRLLLATIAAACHKMQGSDTPADMQVHVTFTSNGLYAVDCGQQQNVRLRDLRLLVQVAPFRIQDILLNADPLQTALASLTETKSQASSASSSATSISETKTVAMKDVKDVKEMKDVKDLKDMKDTTDGKVSTQTGGKAERQLSQLVVLCLPTSASIERIWLQSGIQQIPFDDLSVERPQKRAAWDTEPIDFAIE